MSDFMNDLAGSRATRVIATITLGLLALFLLVLTLGHLMNLGRYEGMPVNAITVTGTGEATAVPDIAQVTFTVDESASSVQAAQDSATKKTDAALAELKKLGVEDKDVKTLGYNVQTQYEQPQPCANGVCPMMIRAGSPKIVGYEVSQTVEVKVRDTAKAGDVLAALGTLGVGNVSGPNFMVDDDTAVSAEARTKAIKDAHEKAEKLAKDLGVHLGKVMSYSEGGAYPMYASYSAKGGVAMDAAVSSAPTLPVGQNETNVTVTVTYEIR